MDELTDEKKESRRDLLKKVGKTAAFVIPTIFTFDASTMAQHASGTRVFYNARRNDHSVKE